MARCVRNRIRQFVQEQSDADDKGRTRYTEAKKLTRMKYSRLVALLYLFANEEECRLLETKARNETEFNSLLLSKLLFISYMYCNIPSSNIFSP